MDADRLVLGEDPGAVSTARHHVVSRLKGGPFEGRADDAALVVTELVTNALLHAGAPVILHVATRGEILSISVQDTSSQLPVAGPSGSESMTGRGLAVVDALARSWGARPCPEGKVVWCELGTDPDEGPTASGPGEHLWDLPEDLRVQYTVDLGDAPTELLLAAKAHVDNMVRELTLMAVGGASGLSAPVSQRLSQISHTLGTAFSEGRAAVKRLAVAAADAGQRRTRLVLTLPLEAVAAAEAYLVALDEADACARTGQLLTLEIPATHRVFRRWYVENLAAHVREAASGEPAPALQTFEERLLEEVVLVAAAQRVAERTARLQRVTAALAAAVTSEEVARVVVSEGVATMAASGGAMVVPQQDETGALQALGAVGYTPDELLEDLTGGGAGLGVRLPTTRAIVAGAPSWVRSIDEPDRELPGGLGARTSSACAIPLQVGSSVHGALWFGFEELQVFDRDERTFLLALAAVAAQALERTELYRAEREARSAAESLASRLGRLQQISNEMARAVSVDEVGDIIVTHLADALGAVITSLALVEGDELRLVRMRGAAAGTQERWSRFAIDAPLPASQAVRTGEVVAVDATELAVRYPLLHETQPRHGSLYCLPLSVGSRRLGVVTLSFPDSVLMVDPAQMHFLVTLAGTCAQALDRANALVQARKATERLALLAEASAELAESRSYRETLRSVARLIVPRLADFCTITVTQDGALVPVTLAHVDPAKVAWALELQQRYPTDPAAPNGPANVIRTGVSELASHITDEMLVLAAKDAEHLERLRSLDFSSVLTVPLTGRDDTFGAITLVYAGSGRHYTPQDRSLVEDLARRAAIAVENARAFETQSARLASISRVAEVAQHAILAPVPTRCGPTRLAGAYVSASKDALIGGDHYEVVMRADTVRMMMGDVRGKGLDAVRLATVVLGLFRAAAADHEDLRAVAQQMDSRVRPYLSDEDFVTALLVDIHPDGTVRLVSCGHPPPLLARAGLLSLIGCKPTVPLGLGADPEAAVLTFQREDRLLLYTDGLIESRDQATGEFLDLEDMAGPLLGGEVAGVLGSILARVQDAAGQRLSDDLAMLVVEFAPE